MSCNICQVKFTFFTKCIGCPNCGFSYCNKCLKYKCDIPIIGRKKVCGPCYNKLNKMKKSNPEAMTNDIIKSNANKEPLAPIDITMKLNSLENPAKPPIVIYKHTSYWDKLRKGLEPVDQQIVDRLQKLKDEQNVPLPTIEEIKQRLALLKDQDPEADGGNINIYQMDTRTDQEKADDLIQEYLVQMELPSTSDPCKEIQDRLNLLQDKSDETYIDQHKKEKIDDIYYEKLLDTTSDDVIDVINMVSAMATETLSNIENKDEDENENENKNKNKNKNENENENENECMICSQTANELDLYICTGCNNELYCPTCFESSHDEIEIIDKHKAICFIKQNKDKEDNLSSTKMNLL